MSSNEIDGFPIVLTGSRAEANMRFAALRPLPNTKLPSPAELILINCLLSVIMRTLNLEEETVSEHKNTYNEI